MVHNITIADMLKALRMNLSPVYRRILAPGLRVTMVTMTSGWLHDMIRVSGRRCQ
jgi:hypothetical protein